MCLRIHEILKDSASGDAKADPGTPQDDASVDWILNCLAVSWICTKSFDSTTNTGRNTIQDKQEYSLCLVIVDAYLLHFVNCFWMHIIWSSCWFLHLNEENDHTIKTWGEGNWLVGNGHIVRFFDVQLTKTSWTPQSHVISDVFCSA